VRQQIDVHHRAEVGGEDVPDEVAAEEAGAAGYEDPAIRSACSVRHPGCSTSYQAMVSASETTSPTTRVAGAGMSASRARPAMSASVPVTDRWCSVVAHDTTAAGSSAGRPASMRLEQTSSSLPAAISTTSVSTAVAILL